MHGPSISRRELLVAGSASAAALLGGCTAPGLETSVSSVETIPVDPGTGLRVHNGNGNVVVTGWDDDVLELEVTRRTAFDRSALGRVTVSSELTDGTLTVETRYEDSRARNRVSVDVRVRVPEGVTVEAVDNGNGNVDARRVTGDASLRTGNGNVTATDVDGVLSLESVNGNVTSSGDVGLERARTTNGAVDATVRRLRDDAVAASVNGSVTVRVAPDLDADVVLLVGNGDVSVSDVPLQDVERVATQLSGRLGDGGPRLEARTVNGDITLRGLS
jgi:DUF4097 and DUF4098 domain-containing protein YvlB